jgi:hypothetical protein
LCEIDPLEARFPETSVELIRKGQTIGSDILAACRNGREKLRDEILTAMKYNHFSVLIAPAAVGPAPKGLEYTGDAVVKYPAAAAGPEGLPPGHEPFRGGAWPGGSCGVSWHILMNIPIDLCGPTCGEYSLRKVAGGTAYGASNDWLLDG